MSTLSYMLTNNITDPRAEGLPCFGMGYGSGNNVQSFRVFNSQLQVINTAYGASDYTTTNSFRHGMMSDPFYMYNMSDQTDAESPLSTESAPTSPTANNWFQSLHQNDQYPIGAFSDCSPLGYRNGVDNYATNNDKFNQGYLLINQVLPQGVRARRFFSILGNVMHESSSLNGLSGDCDRIDFTSYRPVGFTAYTQCYGAAGYNENTKTLVVTYSDGANATLQVNVFTSTVDLNSCTSLSQFFAASTVKGFNVSYTYQAQNGYDRCVVVGNNRKVVVGYRNGNSLNGIIFDYTVVTPTSTALTTSTGTTSYGQSNGNYYYTRMQLSWDGKWAFIYQPYYYYGNGVCGYIVSIEDPTRYFRMEYTGTSGGAAIMPFGESGFILLNGVNTDSTGVSTSVYDFSMTSKTGTASTTYTSSSTGTSTIANAGAVNSTLITMGLHGGYYSTCYPRFMTINWWPINGKFNYEGAVR